MKNRMLQKAVILADVLLQAITFLSLYLLLIYGALNSDAPIFPMILPAAAAPIILYFARRYLFRFGPFILFNLLCGIAILFAAADLNHGFFLVIYAAILLTYSIRAKMEEIDKSDLSEIPTYDNSEARIDREARMNHILAGEHMPILFIIIIIIGYFAGYARQNQMLMQAQMLLFFLFVILQVLDQLMKTLSITLEQNKDRREFPARQLTRVNLFVCVLILVVLTVLMLLLSFSSYGFLYYGAKHFLYYLAKSFAAVLIAIWQLLSLHSSTHSMEEETTTTQPSVQEMTTAAAGQDSMQHILNALFATFSMILLVAALIGIVYLFLRYIRRFNHTRREGLDTIEFIRGEKLEHMEKPKRKHKEAVTGKRKSIRRYFKQGIRSRMKEKPNSCMTPEDLTQAAIVRAGKTVAASAELQAEQMEKKERAEKIRRIYEKTRYSQEEITEEEVQTMKHFKSDRES